MSGMWKRSHGRTSEAPPDERGGYRYVRPTATASHLDSTLYSRWLSARRMVEDAPFWWNQRRRCEHCDPFYALTGSFTAGFDRPCARIEGYAAFDRLPERWGPSQEPSHSTLTKMSLTQREDLGPSSIDLTGSYVPPRYEGFRA